MNIVGRLEYLNWTRPWLVATDAGPVDLAEHFWRFATSNRNKGVAPLSRRDVYELKASDSAEMELRFDQVGWGIIASKRDCFGFTNVQAYLCATLCSLNSRRIIATCTDRQFGIVSEPGEQVFEVFYGESGNSCPVSDSDAQSICKPGTAEACIFLSMTSNGWSCEKFSGVLARMLLERRATNQMRAHRIGDCRNAGRINSTTTPN